MEQPRGFVSTALIILSMFAASSEHFTLWPCLKQAPHLVKGLL